MESNVSTVEEIINTLSEFETNVENINSSIEELKKRMLSHSNSEIEQLREKIIKLANEEAKGILDTAKKESETESLPFTRVCKMSLSKSIPLGKI